MKGWIKLHRTIQEHWIWEDPVKLKWWLDLILMANHKESKILINGELLTIGIGERHTSEEKLSFRWGVSRNTVRKFLKLLQEDEMIFVKKSRQLGTTYKINNYNIYQVFSEEKKQQNEQQVEQRTEQRTEQQKDNELNINKNVKNDKNENNEKNREIYKELEILINFYERNITPQIAPNTLNEMKFLVEDYDPYLIIEAYKIAISKNIKHKESYIKSILSNWLQEGIEKPSQLQKKGAKQNAKSSRVELEPHPLDNLF